MDVTRPVAAYRFEGFVLDIRHGSLLTVAGEDVPLRRQSFDLLRLLVGRRYRCRTTHPRTKPSQRPGGLSIISWTVARHQSCEVHRSSLGFVSCGATNLPPPHGMLASSRSTAFALSRASRLRSIAAQLPARIFASRAMLRSHSAMWSLASRMARETSSMSQYGTAQPAFNPPAARLVLLVAGASAVSPEKKTADIIPSVKMIDSPSLMADEARP
jgi:hypothetical protein